MLKYLWFMPTKKVEIYQFTSLDEVKYMKKEYIICALFTVIMGMFVIYNIGKVNGSPSNDAISQMESEINENESKYNEIQAQLEELNNSKDNLASYIVNLNNSYSMILDSIADLENQVIAKQTQIDNINSRILEQQALIDNQYDNMSMRIQFLYESDSFDMVDSLMRAGTFSEMLNQIAYFNDIVMYDRNMMDELERSLEECNSMKSSLTSELENINSLKEDQNAYKAELEKLMADASINISNHQAQIDEAESIAIAMVEEIENQRSSIEELKAEEARRVSESIERASLEAQGIYEETMTYEPIDGDLKRLAAIIYCESRGEPYEGQVAVGTVVMNRVESSKFPNTVEEVIAQPNQFTPYGMGLYAIALAKNDLNQSCVDAAREVLEKGTRTGNWLFFRTHRGNYDVINGSYIGAHVFY